MAKFVYRMQNILDIKEKIENQEKIAYGLAKPAVSAVLSGMSEKVQGNCSMLVGMCLFVALNYLGQRFFVFKKE